MPIKSIIFDLGNVIATFDRSKAWRALAKMSQANKTPDQIADFVLKKDRLEQLELGNLSSANFISQLKDHLKIDNETDHAIGNAFSDIFVLNQPVIDAINKITKKNRLVLGSNTSELHWEHIHTMIPDFFKSNFDDFILSFDVNLLKPDPNFFKKCIKATKCDPENILYFDDIPDYIEAAHNLGINGVLYTPNTHIEEELLRKSIKLT